MRGHENRSMSLVIRKDAITNAPAFYQMQIHFCNAIDAAKGDDCCSQPISTGGTFEFTPFHSYSYSKQVA
eukprot:scaffold32888_cov37-Cyclotella_meneghiniana.AAC.1